MTILITGGRGKLAKEFAKYSLPEIINPSKDELDVTNLNQIQNCLSPATTHVIHCAAITSVEKCENEKKLAYDVNVGGTRNVIHALKGTKIKLVYISTPCIFDGKEGGYNEHSIPNPENYYGVTKMIGEELVRSSGLYNLIVRANFVSKEPWPYPRAFTDRYGTYLFANEVAKRTMQNIHRGGLIHLVGKKKISMFELAKMVSSDILPMTLDDYNGNAKLTVDMSMRSLYD